MAVAPDLIDSDLFNGRPDFLEVGVEGLWRTVGPVTVWQGGHTPPRQDDLRRMLDRNPALHGPQTNPISLGLGV